MLPFIFLEFQITELSSDILKRASTPPLGGRGVKKTERVAWFPLRSDGLTDGLFSFHAKHLSL
jgi:hypothetical protein